MDQSKCLQPVLLKRPGHHRDQTALARQARCQITHRPLRHFDGHGRQPEHCPRARPWGSEPSRLLRE